MKTKNKKMDIIQYSKSMDKNLRLINKNKNLKEILQDFNNINSKILRYQQIENLLNYIKTKDSEKKPEDINSDKEKEILLEEMKLLQNRLYKSNIENNSKKNVKEVMKDMFGKRDVHNTRRYFPKAKIKLKHLKNLNICSTERNVNQIKKKLERNYTLESEKNKNVNYMNYASNCVKFKHPQFYLLNLSNVNSKKHLPPIKINKVKMVNLFCPIKINKVKMVNLFCKNNNYLKNEEQKRNKFEKYMVAMQMGGISKFKVNE